jgi:tryptophan-rich sensory protein
MFLFSLINFILNKYIHMNNWYETLNRAPWTPPNYVFGIVWSILYVLMFISFTLVFFNKKCKGFCEPILFFLLQLVLNLSWTTVFFTYKQLVAGLILIFTLICLVAYTAHQFYSIDKTASLLLIPYLLWLCVAFSLNAYIVMYN